MTKNVRLGIIAVLVLVIGIIFAAPYFKKDTIKEFAVTPQPAQKLQLAIQNSTPVFLEFWSPK